jgi:hypothetical protein
VSQKVKCALCGLKAPVSKMKVSTLFRPGLFICKNEMACLARQQKKGT